MTRIALISDIHFGRFSRTAEFSVPGEKIIDENTGGESLKEGMVSLLKDENIDFLCVAGDLTSLGSPQEFAYCEDLILDIAEKLGIQEENILLGLGNHDIDWNITELYANFNNENADFPIELVKDQYRRIAASASLINLKRIAAPSRKGPAPFSGIVENDNFVMFVLNTGWCCTRDEATRPGKLDTQQLEWFEKEAAKYRDVSKWKVILMHHHPFNYTYPVVCPDYSTLQEGSNFLDIAGKNGFNLVIHGHRHHPRAETTWKSGWDHPITFVCAGSFAVNASHRNAGSIPNTLHIIELTDEVGTIRLQNFQHSAKGWIPFLNNCDETPLDGEMLFGKLFKPEEITQAIEALPENEVLQWEKLSECLKFMPYEALNKRISTNLPSSVKMIGRFPETVILYKKGGGTQ